MLQSNYIFLSLPLSLRVYLEGSVHASAGNIVGSLSEPDSGSLGRVLTQRLKEKEFKELYNSDRICYYLKDVPLFAEIDPDVRAGHGEVGAAGVEAEVLHLVALVQLQGSEVLQLPQIPELHTAVISRSCQVIT